MKYENFDFEINPSMNPEAWANHIAACCGNYPVKREDVISKLQEVIDKNELPVITNKMAEVNFAVWGKDSTRPRMEAALKVMPKIVAFLEEGFYPEVVIGMLQETLGEATNYSNDFWVKFSRLCQDKYLRKEVWGLIDHVSLFVAKSILADVAAGINIDNPSAEEFEKSTSYYTAKQFRA